MYNILDAMRKNISQHYRGNKMIGTIAVNSVRTFFQLEKKAEHIVREHEIIEGYVKNGKLFLKTSDQALKIEIFKQKKELLTIINQQLEALNYKQKIDEIFLK